MDKERKLLYNEKDWKKITINTHKGISLNIRSGGSYADIGKCVL